MMLELLSPGVQHHEYPDPRPQVLGVGRHLQQGLLGAVEEQPIHQLAVPQGQRAELMGQGEDDVEVRHGQEVGLASGQPGRPLGPPALRTASVAAGMIVVSNLAAVIAPGDVATQRGCAAQRQIPECLPHLRALGPTLQGRGSILPHDLTEGQRRVVVPSGGGRRSSGLTTCCTPARLTWVYRAVVPMR